MSSILRRRKKEERKSGFYKRYMKTHKMYIELKLLSFFYEHEKDIIFSFTYIKAIPDLCLWLLQMRIQAQTLNFIQSA